ncbi:MAG TPA: integron integrase, partial [Gemmatimonadaceae bacterium]|nr:integron integrase [Gemmatimonadaceae bacterium]
MRPSPSPIRLDDKPFTLIGQLRRHLRLLHYSPRTEEAYVSWTRRFVRFTGGHHPRNVGAREITAFLSKLAARNVSASTQNQAVAALSFLYGDVLRMDFPWLQNLRRAKRPARMPVVLTHAEVGAVLGCMTGAAKLVSCLLYGSGLRLTEAVTLRVKDVDFASRTITVRSGKGDRDRVTVLADSLVAPLTEHLARVERVWKHDVRRADFGVPLPGAFAAKSGNAGRSWAWYWVFPGRSTFRDDATGHAMRWHLDQSAVQRAVNAAGVAA